MRNIQHIKVATCISQNLSHLVFTVLLLYKLLGLKKISKPARDVESDDFVSNKSLYEFGQI